MKELTDYAVINDAVYEKNRNGGYPVVKLAVGTRKKTKKSVMTNRSPIPPKFLHMKPESHWKKKIAVADMKWNVAKAK